MIWHADCGAGDMSRDIPFDAEAVATESVATSQSPTGANPPPSIGLKQTIAAAAKMMEEQRVRDLTVIRDGEIVGRISARDVHMIGTLQDVDPVAVTVEDALRMSIDRW